MGFIISILKFASEAHGAWYATRFRCYLAAGEGSARRTRGRSAETRREGSRRDSRRDSRSGSRKVGVSAVFCGFLRDAEGQ